MPRDGSGTHSLPAGYEAVTGQTITANQHNLPLQDLSAEITASVPRDGSAAMTGNLPLGGNRITNVGDATAATDAVNRQIGDARYILASGANVATANIADNAVTTAKIADANVTTAKLADNAVTTAKITDANVTTAKIADANVTTAKLADDAVTAAKIADGVLSWQFVSETDLSSGSSTLITGLGSYKYLRLILTYYPSVDSYPQFQFGSSGGGVDTGSNYAYAVEYDRWGSGGTDSSRSNSISTTSITLSATDSDSDIDADSNSGYTAEILISRFADTAQTMLTWRFFGKVGIDNFIQGTGGGIHLSSTALDRIQLITNTGVFAAGTNLVIEGRT